MAASIPTEIQASGLVKLSEDLAVIIRNMGSARTDAEIAATLKVDKFKPMVPRIQELQKLLAQSVQLAERFQAVQNDPIKQLGLSRRQAVSLCRPS